MKPSGAVIVKAFHANEREFQKRDALLKFVEACRGVVVSLDINEFEEDVQKALLSFETVTVENNFGMDIFHTVKNAKVDLLVINCSGAVLEELLRQLISSASGRLLLVCNAWPFCDTEKETVQFLSQRVRNALERAAIPSFFPRDWTEDLPLPSVKKISVVTMHCPGRVRADGIYDWDTRSVIKKGGLGIIRQDQLLMEVAYILGKCGKYGA